MQCARVDLAVARGGTEFLVTLGITDPPDEQFVELLKDERRSVFVGTYDDAVVGFALVQKSDLISAGEQSATIDLLYVEQDARAVGVGEALFQAIEAWCALHLITVIDAPVLPGDRLLKSFFETQGFRARLLVMQRNFVG
jgi:GNAT superfamily N-acetyltransferase